MRPKLRSGGGDGIALKRQSIRQRQIGRGGEETQEGPRSLPGLGLWLRQVC